MIVPSLRPTTIAPYMLGNVRWQCFVRESDGIYVWRSDCGRYSVRRDGAEWVAIRGEREGSRRHKDIISAMASAQTEPRRQVA